MNKYYVYKLIDPRTHRCFYVGKGKGRRALTHLTEATKAPDKQVNRIKCQIINNILSIGQTPIVEYVQMDLTEQEAYGLEEELIQQYGKMIDGTGPLSNIADGGQGGTGSTKRPVNMHSMSGAVINTFKSLEHASSTTGIHISTICSALNGRCFTAGNYRWSYVGENIPPLPTDTRSPVSQFSVGGEFIREFDSIKDAAEELNLTFTTIVDSIRLPDKNYTAGGFRWAYVGEYPKPLPTNYSYRSRTRKLQGIEKGTNRKFIFDSIVEAVKETAANSTGISDCCAGRKKSSGGIIWKWID